MRIIGSGVLAVLFLGLLATPAWSDEDAELRTEVEGLFRELQDLVQKNDAKAIARKFDGNAMFDVMEREGYIGGLEPKRRAELGARFALTFSDRLSRVNVIVPYAEFGIKRLERTSRRRAWALVRFVDDQGLVSRMRWFLVRRGGSWRIYDYEDVTVSMKLSMMLGAAILSTIEGKSGFMDAAKAMQSSLALRASGDSWGAYKVLDELDTSELPAVIEAVRQIMRASAQLDLALPDRALESLEAARKKNPEAPAIYVLRAAAHNERGEHVKAMSDVTAYETHLAPDANSLLEKGVALAGLGALDTAREAFEAGLADDPSDPDLFVYFALVLPSDRKDQLGSRLAKIVDLDESFAYIADKLVEEEDVETLGAVVGAFEKMHPDHPDAARYRGHLLMLAGDPKGAAEWFQKAWDRVRPDDDRMAYVFPYLEAMESLGKPIEALRAVAPAEKLDAFDYLAYLLADLGKLDALEALTAEAKKTIAAPNEVAFYEGEIAFQRRDYAKARGLLVPLRTRLLNDDPEGSTSLVWEVEDRLVRSHVRAKELEMALELARELYARDGDPRYLAIVYAVTGKHDEAHQMMQAYLEGDGDPAEIFADPELIEITKTKPYATLRAVFWPGR